MKGDGQISLLADSEMLKKPPQVFITLAALKKIQCFVRLAQGEINGLGLVERWGDDFLITDAFILKQKATPGGVETDPMALNSFVAECEAPSKLKFQWHSHGNGGVGFSLMDIETIEGYTSDFMISLVLNKQGRYRCRLDLYQPFYLGFEVPLLVIVPLEEELLNFCRQEIDQKVKETSFFLAEMLPDIIREALGPGDSPASEGGQETNQATIPLEDLVFE